MWLCTQHGFYSVVQKKKDEFHVRARVKRDLENLKELGGWAWKIHESKNADYRWRVVITHLEVISILMNLGEAIDYSNFKGRIHDLPDQEEKSHAYGALWSNLYALQEDEITRDPAMLIKAQQERKALQMIREGVSAIQ